MPGTNSHHIVFSHWLVTLIVVMVGALGIRRPGQVRFSLRTLLIATTLVAVVLGLIVYFLASRQLRRRSMSAISRTV
jgi:hypothetical protein